IWLAPQCQLVDTGNASGWIRRSLPENSLGEKPGLFPHERIVEQQQTLSRHGSQVSAGTTANRARSIEGLQKRKQVGPFAEDINAPTPSGRTFLHVFRPLVVSGVGINDGVRIHTRFHRRPVQLSIQGPTDAKNRIAQDLRFETDRLAPPPEAVSRNELGTG